eukprot:1454852-Pleurochrysis_carterae.AAC.2
MAGGRLSFLSGADCRGHERRTTSFLKSERIRASLRVCERQSLAHSANGQQLASQQREQLQRACRQPTAVARAACACTRVLTSASKCSATRLGASPCFRTHERLRLVMCERTRAV